MSKKSKNLSTRGYAVSRAKDITILWRYLFFSPSSMLPNKNALKLFNYWMEDELKFNLLNTSQKIAFFDHLIRWCASGCLDQTWSSSFNSVAAVIANNMNKHLAKRINYKKSDINSIKSFLKGLDSMKYLPESIERSAIKLQTTVSMSNVDYEQLKVDVEGHSVARFLKIRSVKPTVTVNITSKYLADKSEKHRDRFIKSLISRDGWKFYKKSKILVKTEPLESTSN